MSLRYFAGFSVVFLARLLFKIFETVLRVVSLSPQFAVIIWTRSEINRYAKNDWNSWPVIRNFHAWTIGSE